MSPTAAPRDLDTLADILDRAVDLIVDMTGAEFLDDVLAAQEFADKLAAKADDARKELSHV